MKENTVKSFILEETKDPNLLNFTNTALKRTSNAIFNVKIVVFDES